MNAAPHFSPPAEIVSLDVSQPAAEPVHAVPASAAGGVGDVTSLTRRLVAGDEAAYRQFHEAYFGRLHAYLLVVTGGDDTIARDALQETFRRVVRHIRVFHDEHVFWSWLTVLARTARSDESRRHRRYQAVLGRFAEFLAVHRPPEPVAPDIEAPESLLGPGLEQLPLEDRTLIELKYFQHCSVEAIAARLQTTGKAVESRLSRVRHKLRELILHRADAPAAPTIQRTSS